jgi:hypothetical protein
MRRVQWSITTSTQSARRAADSHRNKSRLHRLSFVCPSAVSQDDAAESDAGAGRSARMRRTTSLLIGIPKAKAICCAMRGRARSDSAAHVDHHLSAGSLRSRLRSSGPWSRRAGDISAFSALDGGSTALRA